MTLREAKERALALLDEDAGSAFAKRCEDRLAMLLSTAQQEAALVCPIVRTRTVRSDRGIITLDADVCRVCEVKRRGAEVPFNWLGSIVEVGFDGEAVLEFWAYPTVLDALTPDSYVFEVRGEAAEALPFYAAALCMLPDEPDRYSVLMALYTARMQGLCSMPKARVRGGRYV